MVSSSASALEPVFELGEVSRRMFGAHGFVGSRHRGLDAALTHLKQRYTADRNSRAKPFVWTKTADETLDKLNRVDLRLPKELVTCCPEQGLRTRITFSGADIVNKRSRRRKAQKRFSPGSLCRAKATNGVCNGGRVRRAGASHPLFSSRRGSHLPAPSQ